MEINPATMAGVIIVGAIVALAGLAVFFKGSVQF